MGSLWGREASIVWQALPFLVAGFGLAFACARILNGLNGLSMGDDVARALGHNIAAGRAICALAVMILCGTAMVGSRCRPQPPLVHRLGTLVGVSITSGGNPPHCPGRPWERRFRAKSRQLRTRTAVFARKRQPCRA
ncbi:iron chelate uptake ABC transporter family permease subunit [Saccharopolyspora phatthalungensis]|uniref:iron chelate uptake ABC transporter family permease subunit n=1 Tax=Saccharopolyspora phatthalungensis TaxID=664693 RepID=UPI0028A60DBD|nr:iron chelate uptake ABC transporter family permease subunit [Saccharopolyspora phatthalungensis]